MPVPSVVRRGRTLAVAGLIAGSLAGFAAVSQLHLPSEEEELALGAQFAAELDRDLEFVDDPALLAYVDGLGQSLARVSQRPHIPYRFRIVDTEEINAFAVPGGYLYVNRGLIAAAENESELAGVLGHEIGHVVGKHSARQLTQQYGLSILASIALGDNPGMVAEITANILATGAITHYSRSMESEADRYGVQELYDAGIDPTGLATFFDKLEVMRGGRGGGALEQFFSTHPDPGDRSAAVQAQIAALPAKPGLRKDSEAFRRAKARLAAITSGG